MWQCCESSVRLTRFKTSLSLIMCPEIGHSLKVGLYSAGTFLTTLMSYDPILAKAYVKRKAVIIAC